jgi:hypothetical protein
MNLTIHHDYFKLHHFIMYHHYFNHDYHYFVLINHNQHLPHMIHYHNQRMNQNIHLLFIFHFKIIHIFC